MATDPRTALITGGSGGIGRVVAATLSQMGISTAIVGRDREKLERVRADLGPAGHNILTAACDVTNRDHVKAMVEEVVARNGPVDILVIGAGMKIRQRSLRSLD